MVGFRNVAIHEYTPLNLDVVHAMITKQLDDFCTLSSTMVKAFPLARGPKSVRVDVQVNAQADPNSLTPLSFVCSNGNEAVLT